mgnify:CR=1 FL=1
MNVIKSGKMENKTKNKVSESVRFLQISLVCYWLSVVLLVVGIQIIILFYEHKKDDSWLRDLFVPIIVPILALAAFFVGVYYSIRDKQTLKKERIEQLKELSKNN